MNDDWTVKEECKDGVHTTHISCKYNLKMTDTGPTVNFKPEVRESLDEAFANNKPLSKSLEAAIDRANDWKEQMNKGNVTFVSETGPEIEDYIRQCVYDSPKFTELSKMIEHAKQTEAGAVLITHPEVLGDDFDELRYNMRRIANAGLSIMIVPDNQ